MKNIEEIIKKTEKVHDSYYIFILKGYHIIRESLDPWVDSAPASYYRISKNTVKRFYDMLKNRERNIDIIEIGGVYDNKIANSITISKVVANLFDVDFPNGNLPVTDMVTSNLIINPEGGIQCRETTIQVNIYSDYIREKNLFRYGDRFNIIVPVIGSEEGISYIQMKYVSLDGESRKSYTTKIHMNILKALSSDEALRCTKRDKDIYSGFVKVYSYKVAYPIVMLLPKDKIEKEIKIL